MKQAIRHGLSALILTMLTLSAWASQSGATRYPIVLVHGLFGFDSIAQVDYFYQIPDRLRSVGADVYTVKLSAVNSNEVRGEQLVGQIQTILSLAGAEKVNLIGHSQGGLAARYAASVIPEQVASVTTIGTPNLPSGFPLGGLMDTEVPENSLAAKALALLFESIAQLIDQASGHDELPQDYSAFLASVSPGGLQQFNMLYPGGVPDTACGNGAADHGGVRYYSWSGASAVTNILDPSDWVLGVTVGLSGEANDGLVTRCGSHLGKVIRDNYRMNHLDEINMLFGMHALFTNPVSLYQIHANRLKLAGL